MYSAWFMCTTSNSIFWLGWYIGREVILWIVYIHGCSVCNSQETTQTSALGVWSAASTTQLSFVPPPPRSSNFNHLPSHSLSFFSFLLTYLSTFSISYLFFIFLSLCLPIPRSSLWRNCLEHAMLWQVRDAHHVPLGATANLQILLPQTLPAPCVRSYPQSILRQVLSSPPMSSSDWIATSTVTRLVSW